MLIQARIHCQYRWINNCFQFRDMLQFVLHTFDCAETSSCLVTKPEGAEFLGSRAVVGAVTGDRLFVPGERGFTYTVIGGRVTDELSRALKESRRFEQPISR